MRPLNVFALLLLLSGDGGVANAWQWIINENIDLLLLANGFGIPVKEPLRREFAALVQKRAYSVFSPKPKALIFWDSCFARASVWDPTYVTEDAKRQQAWALHYQADFASVLLSAEDLGASTDFLDEAGVSKDQLAGLEDLACEDLGVELKATVHKRAFNFIHVSILDRLATNQAKGLILKLFAEASKRHRNLTEINMMQMRLELLRATGSLRRRGPWAESALDALMADINQAAVLGFDGGPPELHVFALKVLCEECGAAVKSRIASGDAIGIGWGAGSTVFLSGMFTKPPLLGDFAMVGLQVLGLGISVWPQFNATRLSCLDITDYAAAAEEQGFPRGGLIMLPPQTGAAVTAGRVRWVDGRTGVVEVLPREQARLYEVFDHGQCAALFETSGTALPGFRLLV